MVTKAIERAQNTVEQRNAEIRKNVLKYDEVMNEQRKVIYERRDQILDERRPARRDPREYLADAVEALDRAPTASSEFAEEWDLDGLSPRSATFWPTELTAERARPAPARPTSSTSVLMGEATGTTSGARRSSARASCARSSAR